MSKTFRKAPINKTRRADSGLSMNQLKKASRTKAAARLSQEVTISMTAQPSDF